VAVVEEEEEEIRNLIKALQVRGMSSAASIRLKAAAKNSADYVYACGV